MSTQTSLELYSKSSDRKAIIIGQAPPRKLDDIPFKKTRLYKWFLKVGITPDELLQICTFEALIDFFPGNGNKGDNKPTMKQINQHIPKIISKISKKEIQLVIPVGKMAIEYVMNIDKVILSEVVGKQFEKSIFKDKNDIYTIIPLPHPSGLSTWIFKDSNDKLLLDALLKIKSHLK